MAKAVICISSCVINAAEQIRASYSCTTSTGINYGADVLTEFSASAVQFALTARQKVAAEVLDMGGPVLNLTDIAIFGGPV